MIKSPPTLLKIQQSLAEAATPPTVLPNFLTSSSGDFSATNYPTSSVRSPTVPSFLPKFHLPQTTPFQLPHSWETGHFPAPCSSPSATIFTAGRIISPQPIKPLTTTAALSRSVSPMKPRITLTEESLTSPTSSDSGCYSSATVSSY